MLIKHIIISLRPNQWTKNILIFTALIFSRNLFNGRMLFLSLSAFVCFCFLSGGVYILNDIIDVESDKKHPRKSKRPIASGALNVAIAKIASAIVILMALTGSFFINNILLITAVCYFVIQVGYSLFFKHIVILDVFSIASGFFLRVMAGANAIEVPVSSWLLLSAFFLSLFIALTKRRHEIILLEDNAKNHRKVLENYNTLLLDQMISVVTASTLVVYAIYTLSEETVKRFNTTNLKYTVPFVLYGIYRYLYIVYLRKEGDSPEIILFKDKPMIVNILFYLIVVFIVIYSNGR